MRRVKGLAAGEEPVDQSPAPMVRTQATAPEAPAQTPSEPPLEKDEWEML